MNADSVTLAKRIWDVFASPKPPQRKQYLQDNPPLNIEEDEKIHFFSTFNPKHSHKAHQVFLSFNELANKEKEEEKKVEIVLDAYDRLKGYENPDLLNHALNLFLTHSIDQLQFQTPSIWITDPELIIPSGTAGQDIKLEMALGSSDESKIDWFREDPLLNEHHGHWHIVYDNRIYKDRQGEMFFYMHRQMLARYEAERLTAGIPALSSFDDLRNPITVGYAAGDDVRLGNLISGQREPGLKVNSNGAAEQLSQLSQIHEDIDSGEFDPTHLTDMGTEIIAVNKLGSTIESNRQAVSKPYNKYHGSGHMHIGALNQGVMWYTQTAVRDVVFWEWHKGIDDLYERLIQRLSKHSVFADRPALSFRKSIDQADNPYSSDIILCRSKDIEGFNITKGQLIGTQAFGEENWEKDFALGEFSYVDEALNEHKIQTTNNLHTRMERSAISYTNDLGEQESYNYDYLTHDEFCYFIRVENDSFEHKQVTVRIFLVPEVNAEQHRNWIEMDKFLHDLPPNSKHVIFRSDEQSSVIRKPVVKDPTTFNTVFDPINMEIDQQRCNCGWPYHLLLPAGGTEGDGTPFRLMVMITDASIDLIGQEPNCGSLSFCGARGNNYPDRRPLGYPFNRPFAGAGTPIKNAIITNDNIAARTIFIKHER